MTLNFIEERLISKESAVLAFFSGTFGTILLISGYIMTSTLTFKPDFFIEGGFVSILGTFFIIVSALLQFSLLKHWTSVLHDNIENTMILIDIFKERANVEDKTIQKFANKLSEIQIDFRPIYFFVVGYIIALLSSLTGLLVFVLALFSLSLYLKNIFRIIVELEDMKAKIYPYLMESIFTDEIYKIPGRNVVGIFILSLITFGIYWYYILFRMGIEINEFIEVDSNLRFRLKEKHMKLL